MNITTTYVLIHCFSCGVGFCLAKPFNIDLVKNQNEFWCPNGHRQSYVGETEAQKIQKKLQREQEAHARTRSNVNSANARTEREKRSHSATKGRLTKTHNRIKNGVCPFCNRSFKNLKAHMDTKHAPDPCHE